MSLKDALDHLLTAETTILSWWQRLETEPDDNEVDFGGMLAAVLRSVSRAAGLIEGFQAELPMEWYCSMHGDRGTAVGEKTCATGREREQRHLCRPVRVPVGSPQAIPE